MRYVPPVGGAADDPYVDGSPSTGVEGSPVPAAAIESPLRELVNVIVDSDLVPDDEDLSQVSAAINKRITGRPNAYQKGQRGAEAALPATTGAVTLNLENSNNWGGTLTGDITLANPSTMPVGQSGVIRLVNGATPRTIAYGSYWKGASGVLPALTAVAGATDLLVYYVESASRVLVSAVGDTK